MEAFYVCIIFLGVLLVIASMFLIIMDRVNGKDFFKEFDRKKDEMFNLIQDSEEMVQELNKMSDYVITVISEKNQEFFNKNTKTAAQLNSKKVEENSENQSTELEYKNQEGLPPVISSEIHKISENEATQNSDELIVLNSDEDNGKDFSDKEIASDKATDSPDVGKSRLVLNSKRREVLNMIEQGLSNDEISDKLKIGKGEIALIRGLSR